MPGASRQSDEPSVRSEDKMPEYGENIDAATFEQILEMDDDDGTREFSKGIVFGFFEQAESTFVNMHKNLDAGDLAELSSLGHFLKGSSATLGLTKVKDSCEKIQHYGSNKDVTGTIDEPDDKVCLSRIKDTLREVEKEYKEIERSLKEFYGAT
ncbi:MAG: hypothetical protein M1825_002869 [Sarcosagium campestre]|nr:MAG: hypothetical protein M1825_002869 [Sarcosagium campestre]